MTKFDYCIFDSLIIAKARWPARVWQKSAVNLDINSDARLFNYEINVAIVGYNAAGFQEVPEKDFPRHLSYIRRESNSV